MKTINYYDVTLLIETPLAGSERTHTISLAIEDEGFDIDFNFLANAALSLYEGEHKARVFEIKEVLAGVTFVEQPMEG